MKKFQITIICLIAITVLLFSENNYTNKPIKILKILHKNNFEKGTELYKLKYYKKSIPYIDKAILISKIIIKQALLKDKALKMLIKAKEQVTKAKKRLNY